jgi:hypothetical protein
LAPWPDCRPRREPLIQRSRHLPVTSRRRQPLAWPPAASC